MSRPYAGIRPPLPQCGAQPPDLGQVRRSTPDNYAGTLFREGHCHDAFDAREGASDQNNVRYSIQIPGMPLRFSGFPYDIELEAPFLGEHNRRILTTISVRATDELPAWSARASCKVPRANNY